MTIQQIQQVLTIATTGSINKAAAQLYISQPNLSKSLQALEQELKVPLFERHAKGVKLTKFGHEFLAYAQPAYHNFMVLDNYCATMSGRSPIMFSAACQYLRFAHSCFIALTSRYRANRINFSFYECAQPHVIESVFTQESEIGVLTLADFQRRALMHLFRNREIEYFPLTTTPPLAIIGSQNPLYHRESNEISMHDLEDYPIVMYRDQLLNFASELQEQGLVNPYNRITVTDRATLYDFLGRTNAYTIGIRTQTPHQVTEYYNRTRAFRIRELSADLEIGWIKSKMRPLSDIAQRYVESITDTIAQSKGDVN